jgi:virulence factor Mce-like protein
VSSRRPTTLVASPVLVGTVTTLVTVIAVFLSYNANSGLPFVPTYDLTARVPDAQGLIRGNEVRVGGKRVGIISAIETVADERGEPVAELELKLDETIRPLRADSRIRVRPRSPLGLKYLELVPGRGGRPLQQAATLPAAAAQPTVELDEVLNAFDAATRRALQGTIGELGTGLTGRGAAFNALLEEAPPLLRHLDRVAGNFADRRTDLDGFLRAADSLAGELAVSAAHLGPLLRAADTTAGALAGARSELGEGIAELPPTEAAGTTAFRAARPVLADARGLVDDIEPGTRLLPIASERLHAALDTGTPVLRRAIALAGRLEGTLAAVERLSSDPLTRLTLERLLTALEHGLPTLRFAAPAQTVCNYVGLWTRNVPETISEGDASGTWFRTLTVTEPAESEASAAPSERLHVNPYPHTAAPGQGGECEAGKEPWLPGRRIGNVPGDQGAGTEETRP